MGSLFPDKVASPISLNHLLYALHDLDRGKVAPLVQPTTPSARSRAVAYGGTFQSDPAAATTCLIQHGLKRAEAAKEVARRLTAMGYRSDSGGRFKGKQIEKWREKMMTERAAENQAVAQYQFALETVKSMDSKAAVDFLRAPYRPFTHQTFLKPPLLMGMLSGHFRPPTTINFGDLTFQLGSGRKFQIETTTPAILFRFARDSWRGPG